MDRRTTPLLNFRVDPAATETISAAPPAVKHPRVPEHNLPGIPVTAERECTLEACLRWIADGLPQLDLRREMADPRYSAKVLGDDGGPTDNYAIAARQLVGALLDGHRSLTAYGHLCERRGDCIDSIGWEAIPPGAWWWNNIDWRLSALRRNADEWRSIRITFSDLERAFPAKEIAGAVANSRTSCSNDPLTTIPELVVESAKNEERPEEFFDRRCREERLAAHGPITDGIRRVVVELDKKFSGPDRISDADLAGLFPSRPGTYIARASKVSRGRRMRSLKT